MKKTTTTTTENKAITKKATATVKKATAKTATVATENKDSVTTAVMNPPADPFRDKEFCKEMLTRCNNIQTELCKIESSYEKIAFDLYYIYSQKGYEVLGYKNIYDLAKDKFDIARGTAHSYVTTVKKFAKRDNSGAVLPEIEDSYKGFTPSQLSVMCSMDEKQISYVTSDMSVRDIKKLSKGDDSSKNESSGSESSGYKKSSSKSGSGSEPSDSDSGIKVEEKSVPTRQVLITFNSKEDYEKNIDNLDSIILRALAPKKGSDTKYKVEVSMVW